MSFSRCPECREFTLTEFDADRETFKGFCNYCHKPIETSTSIAEPSVTVNDDLREFLKGR